MQYEFSYIESASITCVLTKNLSTSANKAKHKKFDI